MDDQKSQEELDILDGFDEANCIICGTKPVVLWIENDSYCQQCALKTWKEHTKNQFEPMYLKPFKG